MVEINYEVNIKEVVLFMIKMQENESAFWGFSIASLICKPQKKKLTIFYIFGSCRLPKI